TDLRGITWRRGLGYDENQLDAQYTGNDQRAAIILKELRDKVLRPGEMRALGFCVTVQHAQYMARVFNEAGIPAAALSGASSEHERTATLADLRSRRINVVFAVDLFNEGLDIPQIDTILLLRPTASATIFLQQLGRGLRRTQDKAVLTVLDFVGIQNRGFSFTGQYRALTGLPRGDLQRAIEAGFPFLPSGCQIVLDRRAQEIVLESIRSHVMQPWRQVVRQAEDLGDVSLPRFLEATGMELPEVIRAGSRSWTQLRREAGLEQTPPGPRETELLRRVRAFTHVDDPARAAAYKRMLLGHAPQSEIERTYAEMLFFSLWPDGGSHGSIADGLRALLEERAVRR